jgi:glycosyltransferase involved in cell wall biosynthesis
MLITLGKQRIFDEFINLIEWVVYEHKKMSPASPLAKMLTAGYRTLVGQCDVVLTDTSSHADFSAQLLRLPRDLFHPVPVSTDETLFVPMPQVKKEEFQVLYYGNMLPLHGLEYVLAAAVLLRDKPIRFRIIGGKAEVGIKIEQAQQHPEDLTCIGQRGQKVYEQHYSQAVVAASLKDIIHNLW